MRETKRVHKLSHEMFRISTKVIGIYGEILQEVLRVLFRNFGVPLPAELERAPIDKRLDRLDEARDALSDTLSAVDELRNEIEVGRQEHQHMLVELSRTLESKESADNKLAALRKLIENDQEILREVTAPQNVARQHTIGFFLGIVASLVAAGVLHVAPTVWTAKTDLETVEKVEGENVSELSSQTAEAEQN